MARKSRESHKPRKHEAESKQEDLDLIVILCQLGLNVSDKSQIGTQIRIDDIASAILRSCHNLSACTNAWLNVELGLQKYLNALQDHQSDPADKQYIKVVQALHRKVAGTRAIYQEALRQELAIRERGKCSLR